jgi:predicted transcriptional regulator
VQDMTTRSRIDIISQILETANGGISTKIKIMYKTNLSYAQLKDYLIALVNKNLISYDLDTNTFKTTEKGLIFLEIYNKLGNIMREEGQQQQIVRQYNEGRRRTTTANLGVETEKI